MRLLGLNIHALELYSGSIPAALAKLRHASAGADRTHMHSPDVIASLPEPVPGKKNYDVLWTGSFGVESSRRESGNRSPWASRTPTFSPRIAGAER